MSALGYTLDDLRSVLPAIMAAAASEQDLENKMHLGFCLSFHQITPWELVCICGI